MSELIGTGGTRGYALRALLLACCVGLAGADAPRRWTPLAENGVHDPANPALQKLQEPAEALAVLPPDVAGNQVDWAKALREGLIKPRTGLQTTPVPRLLDTDILMVDTAEMPWVRFPHRTHTEWLDCSNCHERLFKSKTGATPVTMFTILQGEYCGVCHGAVAFPLTECKRCHNEPNKSAAPAAKSGSR